MGEAEAEMTPLFSKIEGSCTDTARTRQCLSQSILPEPVEAIGAQFGISHRVHDVTVPQEVQQRAGIDAVIGQLEAAGMAQHVRMTPVRRTILRNQALVTGPPRSVLKTNRLCRFSRHSWRSARISLPVRGCVLTHHS